MLIERIYDEDLAQASYLIGCQATGEAIVVDPRRDVDEYLRLADARGVTITAVTETHIHADYLSGTRELAARTGATKYVSGEGGDEWAYGPGFDDAIRMRDGHALNLGNITLTAVHTPGHTPEHLAYLVADGAQADAPGFLLTGDFVFVGAIGRPDLLDEAAGGVDTRFQGAKDLFTSLRDRFLTLPDYVQVLPGHGAGSACGKALGAVPSTTVGYERRFAWWAPYVVAGDEAGFVDAVLAGQPDAHAYFARMKAQNQHGPALLGTQPPLTAYSSERLRAALEAEEIVFLDTREPALVHAGTVPGALNLPGLDKAATYGAWIIDPERAQRPLVVLAATAGEAAAMRDHLNRVGIDTVTGYATTLEGLDLVAPARIAPEALATLEHDLLLDVRGRSEYAAGHVPGAVHVSGGRLLWSLDALPAHGRIVTYCRSGLRSSLLSSALRHHGYDVVELDGSYAAWAAGPGMDR